MSNPIYAFVHIPKTAGTTLNKHFQKNLGDGVLEIGYEKMNFDVKVTNPKKIRNAVFRYVSSLPKQRLKKVRVLSGHPLPYGIHKLFDREVRYFTVIRPEFPRLVSLYNHYQTMWSLELTEIERYKEFYEDRLLVKNKLPNFEQWFSSKIDKTGHATPMLTTKKYLETMGFSNLSKFYFVATFETFEEDSLYLYNLLGINKFFVNQNKSTKFYKPTKKESDKYIKILKPSYKIYGDALRANRAFKKTNIDFNKRVLITKRKKKLFTPFTQIAFDTKASAGLMSLRLRKLSPLYSKVLNAYRRSKMK